MPISLAEAAHRIGLHRSNLLRVIAGRKREADRMNDEQPIKPQNECAAARVTPQPPQPNLEEWIERYGGRARIPWAEWDRAVEAWKAERRAEFERKKLLGRMQSTALQQRWVRSTG
jgi:hypothetical protein